MKPSNTLAPSAPAEAAIRQQVAALSRGQISSYGKIAERAGYPGRARLVARVLAQLPADSGLPWHRVLRAGGRIAFAPGSDGYTRQQDLLQREGWQVLPNGQVVGAARADLDAALWGPG